MISLQLKNNFSHISTLQGIKFSSPLFIWLKIRSTDSRCCFSYEGSTNVCQSLLKNHSSLYLLISFAWILSFTISSLILINYSPFISYSIITLSLTTALSRTRSSPAYSTLSTSQPSPIIIL